ncbi:MAG TPA: Mur ligase family protein, partial [Pirellulales bacterium]|nr:Mur ligase family protein [Pirellulales bacterium]
MIDWAQPARGISLRQHLPEAVFDSGDVYVHRCCAKSRHCRPGDLFVALPGKSGNRHEMVAEAIRRGATAVLTGRPIAGGPIRGDTVPGDTAPLCLVDDVHQAYGRICQALAGNPAQKLKLVGIAGTRGRTTTSYLTAAVLAAGGMRSGVLGALGYFDGETWQNARRTTPPPPMMAQCLARMAATGCTHAVMEISSGGLDRQHMAGLSLD